MSMPIIEIRANLKKLQTTYQPFSDLWNQWTISNYCDLNAAEVRLIEFHVSNNFKINLHFLLTYYAKHNQVKDVIPKLTESYPNYCIWIARTFQFSILSLLFGEVLENSLKTNIERLKITEDLKGLLLKFGKNSLSEIFDSNSDNDFCSGRNLELATQCLKILYAKSQITNPEKSIPTMTETA